MVQVAVTKTSVSSDHPSNYRAMAMVTTLFFMWGFLTALERHSCSPPEVDFRAELYPGDVDQLRILRLLLCLRDSRRAW